ncbi:hypothetical protein ACFL2Y_01135 [Candidatus Omnitrophota bacterium]
MLIAWLIGYFINVIFFLWIIKWGGAKWLSGRFLSGLLFWPNAPRWDADGIKLFVWLEFIAATIWFVVGIFVPEARLY